MSRGLEDLQASELGITPRRSWLSGAAGAALVALFAGAYLVQSHIDASFGEYRATEEILYVDSGELLKKVSLGFENVAADLYWLRTVQYFGGKRLDVTNKNYDLLEPLLWITVELDPNFKIAYTYGATFLSEPFPTGAGLPVKGIELIDRGIQEHPDYWRFYLDKGFIYFWYLQDYEKAAETFLEGSKIRGRALLDGRDRGADPRDWRRPRDGAAPLAVPLRVGRDASAARQRPRPHEAARCARRHRSPPRGDRALPRGDGLVSLELERSRIGGLPERDPRDPAGNPYLLGPGGKLGVSSESSLGRLPVR